MRKTREITITDVGRDKGNRYLLTEMSADQAERWAFRMLLALANAGARIPDDLMGGGMASIAATIPGFLVQSLQSLAGMRYEDVGPLLTEMMGCVQFLPPGTGMAMPLAPGDACQIEEVKTRVRLRYEVLQLHVDFSLGELLRSSTPPPSQASSP